MTTPTPAELEILNVLWKNGEANTQTVNNELNKIRPIGYTTTLKSMQLMVDKGYLDRRREGKSHVYFPVIQESATKGNLLDRFINATYAGSKSGLLMQLFGGKQVSKDEIEQIKAFISDAEQNNNSRNSKKN